MAFAPKRFTGKSCHVVLRFNMGSSTPTFAHQKKLVSRKGPAHFDLLQACKAHRSTQGYLDNLITVIQCELLTTYLTICSYFTERDVYRDEKKLLMIKNIVLHPKCIYG